jgi:hypothetical protein
MDISVVESSSSQFASPTMELHPKSDIKWGDQLQYSWSDKSVINLPLSEWGLRGRRESTPLSQHCLN